jgi:hypothetical protein
MEKFLPPKKREENSKFFRQSTSIWFNSIVLTNTEIKRNFRRSFLTFSTNTSTDFPDSESAFWGEGIGTVLKLIS